MTVDGIVHAYGALEGLTMCGIHEKELPTAYGGYTPPRRGRKDRDKNVTCPGLPRKAVLNRDDRRARRAETRSRKASKT